MPSLKCLVVSTKGSNARNHPSFQKLGPETTFVHINSLPYLWAIELILEKAPNIKTIQVIPAMMGKITSSHQKLCQERNVQIIKGRWRQAGIWGERAYQRRLYQPYRDFFLGLEGRQKDIFDTLILCRFQEAIVTARYLCLKGEHYFSQRIIAQKYGLGSQIKVSRMVRGLLHFFDPSFEVSVKSEGTARSIAKRFKKVQLLLMVLARLNISKLPDGLPLYRLGAYEAVLRAWRDGRLADLKEKNNGAYQVIYLRFGLRDGVCRTLKEIAYLKGFISREGPRQLEKKALKILGIKS